ncbi:MAG: glycosyltransferase [bacterium]
MIFASLGTTNTAFTRMAKAVDDFAATTSEEVIVQTGHTDYEYKYAIAFKYCTKDEMQSYIDKADILILQGGWGAISEAMEKRKRIVVIPRIDGVEHIHDQIQLVKKLDSLGCVIGVFDENDLPQKIAKAYDHEFTQIKRGSAEGIIRSKLKEWFG